MFVISERNKSEWNKWGWHSWLVLACILGWITCFSLVKAEAEHWSAADSPFKFANDLIMTLADLPMTGEANEIPWAGYYWPIYKDSINDPWEGLNSKPPSRKYAEAFGHNTNFVLDQVSRYHGIDSQSHRTVCTDNTNCTTHEGVCAKRSGSNTGYCIPTWFGIGHGWAPASILLPEPKHAVDYNGVNFKVRDLKALITIIYNRTVCRFVSLRCNTVGSGVQFDDFDRPSGIHTECRDTNPGTLHLLLTNYLGIRGSSFIEDRVWDHEVWNQPIRGYRIIQQTEVTARTANQLIGVTSAGGTTHTGSSTVAKNGWFHMDPIPVTVGKHISVTMTGTNDADLYVRLGSQPTFNTYDCRPYQGSSNETCELIAQGDTQLFISVNGYADISDFNIIATIGGGIPDEYQFNDSATNFFHVKIEVDYIGMSSADTDGYLGDQIDRFTHTDTYEYVLETRQNSTGKQEVIGGEYLGSSKTNHPDFLWLPISHRGTWVAGSAIKRSEVMAVYEKLPQPADKIIVNEFSDIITVNEIKHYGPFNVKNGKKLSAFMTGTNDADLYVRIAAIPTDVSYDCRPYKSGSNEECHLISTGTPIYVSVKGYASASDFSLRVEYVDNGDNSTPVNPPDEVSHLNLQDAVGQGEAKYYTIDLPAGYATTIRTYSSSDVDLYIRINEQPTTSDYLMRSLRTTGNETLMFTPQESVTLHIMVYGYEETSSFTLRTAAQ